MRQSLEDRTRARFLEAHTYLVRGELMPMPDPQETGFLSYAGEMELELHGTRVRCKVPTLSQVAEILELRRQVVMPGGSDEAFLTLLVRFPAILGLEHEFAATPMLASEFLAIVTRFFALPPRGSLSPLAEAMSPPAGMTS